MRINTLVTALCGDSVQSLSLEKRYLEDKMALFSEPNPEDVTTVNAFIYS